MPSSLSTALRWLPTFLGFPAGGLAAELIVGHVDAPGPAIAGGAITGAILGVAQWLGLRRHGLAPEPWVAATAAGLALGLGAGASIVDYQTDIGSLAVQGLCSGAAVGLAQALVLAPRLRTWAAVWPAALAGCWALGWSITTWAGVDVEEQYTVFGSTGAITVTALTSVLPVLLARQGRTPR
jgi:hypothetical protein